MKDVKIDRCELAGGSTRLLELKNLIKETILKTNPSFISFKSFTIITIITITNNQ